MSASYHGGVRDRLKRGIREVRGLWVGLGAVLICLAVIQTVDPAAAQGPPAGNRSPGCALPASGAGTFRLSTTDGTGKPRTYKILVPVGYDPRVARALVFVFHAAGGNSDQSLAWGLQNAAGAAADAIFVFPDGIAYQNYGIGWDDTSSGHDLPFFDNMRRDVQSHYCIDTARIFAAGFSWGADFVIALACNRGEAIRAVAANSASDDYRNTADYSTYFGLPCPAHQHPAMRFEHAASGDSSYPAPDFATTTHLLRFLNSCSATATPVRSSTAVKSCVTFEGCTSRLLECTFDQKLGHVLPPNWAQDTWDFFEHAAQ